MPDRPLIVTADPSLLDELLRLCSLAGVEPEVVPDVGTARRRWLEVPLVVVGGDLAQQAARAGLSRRRDVVIVVGDLEDAGVWDVAVELGADTVVFLPDAQAWLADRFAQAGSRAPRPGVIVAVVGGRGGAGATTLAAALSVTAARMGRRALLVDGDPLGGGIDLALGGEDAAGLRWPDLAVTGGRVDGSALRAALPQVHQLTVLSWDRGDQLRVSPAAMRSVLTAAASSSEVVVVDLPRQVDAATEVALEAADVTLLVVPAEVRATAAAARVAVAVGLLARDLRAVVRGPSPAGLTGQLVADTLGLPLAGYVKAEPGLEQATECGQPPARHGKGPLATFCRGLLGELTSVHGTAA